MQKRNIFLWTLYDFSNSIVEIVFFLYFAQWLVVERGVSDFSYNLIFTVGSVLLLFTAPVWGTLADQFGREQRYLNRLTVLTFLCFLGAALATLFFRGHVLLAALLFLFANYFYQFSFVFYNTLLHYLAPPERWGRISGIGQAGNWLGQIAGLLLVLPFASGALYLFGAAGRAQTFLPATIVFFLLALPMLLFFRMPKRESRPENLAFPVLRKMSFFHLYREQWRQFKDLLHAPGMGLFLLSYFFFNDAILTASNNFPIYLEQVFSVSDTVKSSLLAGILATSVVGALCSGFVADKIGLKRTLLIVLGSWVVLFPLLGTASHFSLFVVLAIFMGFLYGAIWTVTRAAMTALTPKEKLNFGFSFYTLAERTSTLIGPLAWGGITTFLVGLGSTRYRIAAISMAVFVAIGLYLLRGVTIKESAGVSA